MSITQTPPRQRCYQGDHANDFAGTMDAYADGPPRWIVIVEAETTRLEHARPGAPYPAYDDLMEQYETGRPTITKVTPELRRRGLIQRVSAFRGAGHVVAGGGVSTPEPTLLHRLTSLHRTGEGQLYPTAGEGHTCPVCAGNRRGEPRPVYGYACSTSIRSGAVISPNLITKEIAR
ncbi:hypothetical protein ACFCYC_33670 [Streptomyces sp. NPDC056402]|uniref:hypothetical protein n=1 Tax=Streptomyces sp. NPDC056402 TaxID=3345810 RepID=UPI0035D7CDAB